MPYDLSVCLHSYLRNQTSELFCFLWMIPVAVARSFLGGVAACYVLPVSWMTPCFPKWALWRRDATATLAAALLQCCAGMIPLLRRRRLLVAFCPGRRRREVPRLSESLAQGMPVAEDAMHQYLVSCLQSNAKALIAIRVIKAGQLSFRLLYNNNLSCVSLSHHKL